MGHLIAKLINIDEHWKILIFSIIIVVLFGILPSCWGSDWEWFSRSGALLVVYGIYIVWRDIKGDIDSALVQIDAAASKKLASEKSEKVSVLITKSRRQNKRLYDWIEFVILAAGTLIWAYGDLINKVHS